MSMNESTANEFYNRLVEGTDYEETITLSHPRYGELEDVRMSPVNKRVLAKVISKLPRDIFDAVEEADDPDEAEEMLEGSGGSLSALSEDTVDAFEDLCRESLSHPELTSTQMNKVVEELDFQLLFEIGGDVMDMSFSDENAIKDFRKQD